MGITRRSGSQQEPICMALGVGEIAAGMDRSAEPEDAGVPAVGDDHAGAVAIDTAVAWHREVHARAECEAAESGLDLGPPAMDVAEVGAGTVQQQSLVVPGVKTCFVAAELPSQTGRGRVDGDVVLTHVALP